MRAPLPLTQCAATLLLALTGPLWAEPTPYQMDPAASTVGFETDFGADKIKGTFPLSKADIAIDFKDLRKSTVTVTLDASGAEASFPFAAQAMKGPKVLDTADYPTIDFASTGITAAGQDAKINGTITLRGVTRPFAMTAHLYQVAGAVAGDYRQLTIALSGALNRSDFGATGWADMVGDQVRITVMARIDRKE